MGHEFKNKMQRVQRTFKIYKIEEPFFLDLNVIKKMKLFEDMTKLSLRFARFACSVPVFATLSHEKVLSVLQKGRTTLYPTGVY